MIADMIIVPKRLLIADLSIPIYMKGNLVGLFLKCVYALTECCLLITIFVSKESAGALDEKRDSRVRAEK